MTSSSSENPIADVLLVEDNPQDVTLIRHLLKEAAARINLHVAEDGEDAVEFLRRQGRHARSPRPELIILDLNIPKKNGHEVLREIKADPDLRSIPVVVLTTSRADEDVLRSYDERATSFITKSINLNEYAEAIKTITHYWLNIVVLPPKAPGY